MWFGCARFKTVLLNSTINSSCSRLNNPVNGWSPTLVTIPSLTHCQNCVCVVQNCFRSRHTTSAVFFFRFFFFACAFGFIVINAHLWLCVSRNEQHTHTHIGKPLLRGSIKFSKQSQLTLSDFTGARTHRDIRSKCENIRRGCLTRLLRVVYRPGYCGAVR